MEGGGWLASALWLLATLAGAVAAAGTAALLLAASARCLPARAPGAATLALLSLADGVLPAQLQCS
ncbi:hypothetical protein [Thermogemmatispora carboxidivorans]|uniref:hypothetical protein n=1 Tax=Thermogemmatispora carboxidivorans TaxID=1382306 RepID=UPI00069C2936|nr:hypothetical protein [Thermogemmatispora carboxidivorans]